MLNARPFEIKLAKFLPNQLTGNCHRISYAANQAVSLDRAVMEMRSSGFSEQELVARENTLRKNILEKTETLLKEHFILERIAEQESVEDEPQDYEIEIARIAMQQNDSPRRVRARLERAGQMDSLRNMIIERKVIDLITESANFKGTDYETDEKADSSALTYFAARAAKEASQKLNTKAETLSLFRA